MGYRDCHLGRSKETVKARIRSGRSEITTGHLNRSKVPEVSTRRRIPGHGWGRCHEIASTELVTTLTLCKTPASPRYAAAVLDVDSVVVSKDLVYIRRSSKDSGGQISAGFLA